MEKISTTILEKAVYEMCFEAGCKMHPKVYEAVKNAYSVNNSERLKNILKNGKKASEVLRPLCQDTGSVHVFLKIGRDINFEENPIKVINNAVAKLYKDEFFRKSIIENSFLSAKNTNDNTPAIIETEFTDGNELEINILLKGAGCDNMSFTEMMLPSTTKEDLKNFLVQKILKNGKFACPPLFVSVACGGSSHNVLSLAERGFFDDKNDMPELCGEIIEEANSKADKKYEDFFLADLKIKAFPHHMASLPLGVAINCHSMRKASVKIKNGEIIRLEQYPDFSDIEDFSDDKNENVREIHTNEPEKIKSLKTGEKVLLTGKIFIARDAAHKRMLNMIENNEPLPFCPDNAVIFYAGPCPSKPGEIIGPVGPTTSVRMDKYLSFFPTVVATMGKGSRSSEGEKFIKENNKVYFEVEGGISVLLSSRFKSQRIIAFEDLGAEALREAYVEKLPVTVATI